MKITAPLFALLAGLLPAQAKDLNIVTDIAPVGSLVAKLTDHNVTVLLQPGQSPHDASLKPSQARALRDADVVFWMGEGLTPSLERALEQLSGDAVVVDLMALEDVPYLDFRDAAVFEIGGDSHDGDHDDHGDHDEHHDDEKHDDHEDHDAHDHHGDTDPHAWLSPKVASQWMAHMAQALTAADPQSGEHYSKRAETQRASLERLYGDMRTSLAALADTGFFVAHDAFQYFESDFAINVLGAISGADGASASVARIKALQESSETAQATCLMTDASTAGGSAQKMARTLGIELRALDSLHPTPSIEQLPLNQQYDALLGAMADQFLSCLAK